MRKGEIFGLQAGQVDLASRIVTLRDGETKTDEGRQVALTTEAVALFKLVMPTGNRPDARLFNVNVKSTVNEFRAGCKAAGLGDVRFHDARRESATRLSKHMNVMELAAQTGHSNINTLYRVYYKKNATARAAKLAKIAI